MTDQPPTHQPVRLRLSRGRVWPRFVVEHGDGKMRTFSTFERAERFARDAVKGADGGCAFIDRADGQFEIDHDLTTKLASVTMDALGRVWTDMRQAGDDLLRLANRTGEG